MSHWKRVWTEAAEDLGLQVHFDIVVRELEGEPVATVHLAQFGAENGMLIFDHSEVVSRHGSRLIELGYGYSVMDAPRANESYERDDFVEMLADWGWTGRPQARPTWLAEDDE